MTVLAVWSTCEMNLSGVSSTFYECVCVCVCVTSLFLVPLSIAHTPDNTFLGFVVEQHLNASDIRHIDEVKRQNQSLVYGKVDNFWKVRSPGGSSFKAPVGTPHLGRVVLRGSHVIHQGRDTGTFCFCLLVLFSSVLRKHTLETSSVLKHIL